MELKVSEGAEKGVPALALTIRVLLDNGVGLVSPHSLGPARPRPHPLFKAVSCILYTPSKQYFKPKTPGAQTIVGLRKY